MELKLLKKSIEELDPVIHILIQIKIQLIGSLNTF